MTVETAKYSLKIWLTSILISSLLFVIAELAPGVINQENTQQGVMRLIGNWVFFYLLLALIQATYSFITWVVFMIIIHVITILQFKPITKKILISSAGIALAVITFMIVLPPSRTFYDKDGSLILLLANSICAGAGAWFYKIGDIVKDRKAMYSNGNLEYPGER